MDAETEFLSKCRDVKELADFTGFDRLHIWRQYDCGQLPGRKIGHALRFTPSDMKTWLKRAATRQGTLSFRKKSKSKRILSDAAQAATGT